MPPGLFPQPSLDVEQRVGDVEPGVEQADVVTARRLKNSRCENCEPHRGLRVNQSGKNVVHSEALKEHSSQTMQKLLFCREIF